MRLNDAIAKSSRFMLAGVAATLALSINPGAAWAGEGRSGELHVTKECKEYTGAAGSFCKITSSNLGEIKIDSKVFYDQAAGVPAGLLDANVVLDAGNGNRALGRCTLDLTTGFGLCTFSDGIGDFAGFHARVKVSPPTDGLHWHWDGTYSFKNEGED